MSRGKATKHVDHGVVCPYCGAKARLADSSEIYGKSYGPAYLCSNYPRCDAYVGCHPGTTKPLGRLANKELRQWKKGAHRYFDRLWKGPNATFTRADAYAALAAKLGVTAERCHIGMFDVAQCKAAVEAAKALSHT